MTTIRFGRDLVPEDITTVIPGWLKTDEELQTWLATVDTPPTADQLNAVGWAFSFTWRFGTRDNRWVRLFPNVDMLLALECFERAAQEEFWAALNNLGVIWRDGLGVVPDPQKAFYCFTRAAKSGEPTPMRHLARCYREGHGCEVDHNMAVHLDIMANDIEAAAQRERYSDEA
ncbi:tetratricopeptide repeat protein [Primorskyibacter sp. 2E107]